VNVVLAVCDPGDPVALFLPYYFNHLMAFQMSGELQYCAPTLRQDYTRDGPHEQCIKKKKKKCRGSLL